MSYDRPKMYPDGKNLPRARRVVDAYEEGVRELFFVENPSARKGSPESEKALTRYVRVFRVKPVWVYFPWLDTLVRSLPENEYFKVRTARNRNLITFEEQISYRNFKAGVAGLSVGSSIISALVISGGPKILKIADFDRVEISNLNRLQAKLTDVGENKTLVAARRVWELDPFARLTLFPKGLTKQNIKAFLTKIPRLDAFVDEMDDIELKILARKICKREEIPVLMATDNGEGVIFDVERFDLQPKREIFHGVLKKINSASLKNLSYKKWLGLANQIIGWENLTQRMRRSLSEIGKTISAVPQLGPTASLSAVVVAFAVRRIANKQDLPSGRYFFSLENTFHL